MRTLYVCLLFLSWSINYSISAETTATSPSSSSSHTTTTDKESTSDNFTPTTSTLHEYSTVDSSTTESTTNNDTDSATTSLTTEGTTTVESTTDDISSEQSTTSETTSSSMQSMTGSNNATTKEDTTAEYTTSTSEPLSTSNLTDPIVSTTSSATDASTPESSSTSTTTIASTTSEESSTSSLTITDTDTTASGSVSTSIMPTTSASSTNENTTSAITTTVASTTTSADTSTTTSSSTITTMSTDDSTTVSSSSMTTTPSSITTSTFVTNETTEESTASTGDGTTDNSTVSSPTESISTGSTSTTPSPTTITTTPTPSTSTISLDGTYVISTENAFLTVPLNVTFPAECAEKDTAQNNITKALFDIGMIVIRLSVKPSPCTKNGTNREKRSGDVGGFLFNTNVRARDFIGNITAAISKANDVVKRDLTVEVQVNLTGTQNLTMCDTDVCREAGLNYKGFTCESINTADSNCTFSSPCSGDKNDCNYGKCEIKATGSQFHRFCNCNEEDMYKYEYSESSHTCERGDLSFKAWMIVAAGAGGLIIVVLLFAIVIQCARRKGDHLNPEKYGYDVGYNDRETLMHDRSYDPIDQYHRKPSVKVDDPRSQTSLQTFDNQGYDHWDPEESKETYQSMDRHFQSPGFQAQISRPKLTSSRYGEDKLTPF